MTAAPGPPGPTDAELVERVLAADREAFAVVYDRYGGKLYDFAYSMLRHREDAADAVADSFVLFAERLGQLRDPDRLRPWLYAIVRSECLRRLKARKRVAYGDDEQLVEMADDATTPEESAERAALQALVWDASAGLADRDRALLDLHLRQGLEGAELGEAMGVSAANAYVMLNRLRAQVDRSLGALLIARLGRDACEELDSILAGWDGGFSPLVRKRVARHVDGCDVCSERRRKMVSPWMLLAGVPMFAAPLALRDRVLRDTELVAHKGPGGPDEWSGGRTVGSGRWGAAHITTAAAALLLLAVLAAVLLWPDTRDTDAPAASGPTPTATAGPGTSGPAPSSAPSTSDPSTQPASTSPASPTQRPGELVVSTRSLDLGRTASTSSFGIANAGDVAVLYQVSSRTPWIAVEPIGGKLPGQDGRRIDLRVDRDAVREGRSSGSVVVSWDGGSTVVRVHVTEERGPTVSVPSVPPGSSCDVTVTVRATDESGVAGVSLAWSGPEGPGTAAMSGSGATWSATIHVAIGGSFTFRASATDSRGNTAQGGPTTVAVDPCPQ
ncbi:RNA polymerase sigma factor (sigma-70 family) [Marmoricola sp. URHA0025 HA25]